MLKHLANYHFHVPSCCNKTKARDRVCFFLWQSTCASFFWSAWLFLSNTTRHKASNQEGQGKPLRSLTSHRRVNDLRGAPRPSWLRALCQVFDTKSQAVLKNDKHLAESKRKKNDEDLRFCWVRQRYMEIIFWNLRVLRPVQFIFSPWSPSSKF